MPTKYVRKTDRSVRSPADVLERAAKQVSNEGLSYQKAADNFEVDKMTLLRSMKKNQADPNSAVGYCGCQKMAPHVNKWLPLDGAHE